MERKEAVAVLRNSVAGIMRIRMTTPARVENGVNIPPMFNLQFVGTAFCVVDDRFLVTAQHVFNGGQPREAADKFYVFAAPGNQDQVWTRPVVAFPHEDAVTDLAVIEIGAPPVAARRSRFQLCRLPAAP